MTACPRLTIAARFVKDPFGVDFRQFDGTSAIRAEIEDSRARPHDHLGDPFARHSEVVRQ